MEKGGLIGRLSKSTGDNLGKTEEGGKGIKVGEGEMRKDQQKLYVKMP